MIDSKMTTLAVKIILEYVLTPVIYMLGDDYEVNFICFCDRDIEEEVLVKTETQLHLLFNRKVEILDIRSFDVSDRLEIIKQAEMIHSENTLIQQIFELSMIQDFKKEHQKKQDMLQRKKECSSMYLQ
jgi:hypothetical protein